LIVPSNVYAEQMIAHYGYRAAQMRPIHHGTHSAFVPQSQAAVAEARKKWGIEENAILSITNTLPHKNVRNLVAAFHRLITHYGVRAQLVLVGNVNPQVLQEFISETAPKGKLSDRVRVMPFLPNDQLPPIYGAASVFTFVSLTETFGMPLTEAMACGVPIIASDIPVHREILNGAGCLVNPADSDAIAAAMHTVLTDRAKREQLKAAALARGRSFSWKQTALQTLAVYEAAVNHRSR
jgi:alpha-1,3-rhamnosyl/mannosyltransferase